MQQTTSLHSKSNTTTHQYTALCDSGPSLLLCAYSTSLKTLTSELLRHVPFSQRHTGRTKSGWKTIMATVLIRRRLSRRTTTSNSKPQLDTAGTKTVPNLTYLLTYLKKTGKLSAQSVCQQSQQSNDHLTGLPPKAQTTDYRHICRSSDSHNRNRWQHQPSTKKGSREQC